MRFLNGMLALGAPVLLATSILLLYASPVRAEQSHKKFMLCHTLRHLQNAPSTMCPSLRNNTYNYTRWFSEHVRKSSLLGEDGALEIPRRVVLSYGHNGLGNMLWQHTVAQMVAEDLDASMYVFTPKKIPGTNEWWIPPNSVEGAAAVSALLPPDLFLNSLPKNHPHKALCLKKNISFFARPKDKRDRAKLASIVKSVNAFASDRTGDYCMVMLGYFQETPPSISTARGMWHKFLDFPLHRIPDPTDLGFYIRCTPHYPTPTRGFLGSVLNGTGYGQLYVMHNDEGSCKLPKYASIVVWTKKEYRAVVDSSNAGLKPTRSGRNISAAEFLSKLESHSDRAATLSRSFTLTDLTSYLHDFERQKIPYNERLNWNISDNVFDVLHDISMIAAFKKLILPQSSFAFWGGFLSDAKEEHPLIPDPKYIYHVAAKKQFARFTPHNGTHVFSKFTNLHDALSSV